MEVYNKIKNAKLLTNCYGYFPDFHDAEVIKCTFDRGKIKTGIKAKLVTLIHVFDITSEVSDNGKSILTNHNLVEIIFHNINSLKFDFFNYQNVLQELAIEESEDEFLVEFVSSFGVDAKFKCDQIEILDLQSCSATGEIISA